MATCISTTAIGENFPVDPAEKTTRQATCLNRAITGTTEPFVVSVCSTAVPSPVTLTDGEAVAIVAPDDVGTAADARRRLYVSVAVTYLAALSCGLSMAYSSPALPSIRKVMEFSDGDSDCFGSLVTLGAVIGGVSGGKRGIVITSIFTFSDCFYIDAIFNTWWSLCLILFGHVTGRQLSVTGRRGTLIASSAWYMSGWACLAVATPKAALFVGRLLTGVGTGMVALAVTVFISEISPSDLRGLLNTGANLVLSSGILVVFVLGKFFSFSMLAICCMIPAAIMAISLLWCHESPRWLLKNGLRDRAAAALRFYVGPFAATELVAMEQALVRPGGDVEARFTLRDLTSPRIYRSFLCVLLVMSMQQLSAVGVIITFAQDIFEEAGTSVSAENAAIAVAAIQVRKLVL
ncbi:solute carrier family 2, facilitated glucose transporter member 8-like [Rhipicephalus microplus]|uniref:solute carrier family 2, facilitated glucose transporter member 8-like n=1 Tax=Rhipicephalus microplus TaxID=6941 RepID=UPI003F6D8104